MWANLCKKSLRNVAIPLVGDNLSTLASSLTCNAQNKFEKKNKWKRSCASKNRIYIFLSNEDMNDIIKIIKLLEDSNVLIDGITETVKYEIKKQGGADFFLLCYHL